MASSLAFYTPRVLLTGVAGITAIVPYIADYNETHVFNPRWPGHARFHNGQTMSMGSYLGVLTLWKTCRGGEKDNLLTASVIAAAYYITMGSAYYYPGATAWDPPQHFTVPYSHLYVVIPMLSIVATAFGLEQWRVTAQRSGEQKKAQ
ncbi:hypothetical protein LTR91_010581 [Friedmanniomyces endolithicus]|uniref:Uncharacterized protein n=1 Tax=Friedmanniomyces endolithicus TaxID=329885 RepID=A0AAN6F6S0_9PEZI|nr:hypothetical protein LTR35_017240 [Friedmanniomyces endolithicus]KAK0270767.1 hypothetical protein LTS00_016827 [Friedmanniomyces endolithicus]KAK0305050.1 hypothetical protein LTR82_016955 [Friedmanniomyces endolithicus]KAK0952580.1 hypothetical protein LTS01_024764 [Friedmanniomyces endolithicus]KAK0975059.1 hypothetical protein LTR54_016911 [Friedmanniomyces endolithicus]